MANTAESVSRSRVDVAYDACFSGPLGGSFVAIFFLLIDELQGRPFFTPSFMGSVLFGGAAADTVSDVSYAMVGYYSMVHFAAFGLFGAVMAYLVYQVELHTRHPVLLLLLMFAILEVGFVVATSILMPGVIRALGALEVGVANLIATAVMGIFLLSPYHPGLRWRSGQAGAGG